MACALSRSWKAHASIRVRNKREHVTNKSGYGCTATPSLPGSRCNSMISCTPLSFAPCAFLMFLRSTAPRNLSDVRLRYEWRSVYQAANNKCNSGDVKVFQATEQTSQLDNSLAAAARNCARRLVGCESPPLTQLVRLGDYHAP